MLTVAVMEVKGFACLFFFLFAAIAVGWASFALAGRGHRIDRDGSSSSTAFNVMSFGAVGNGRTDDSHAFLEAWEVVCKTHNPSTLLVPAGKSFLLNPLRFKGPCISTWVNVQILGNILATEDPSDYTEVDNGWISFEKVNGLTIFGSGQIDGQGSQWWNCRDNGKCSEGPTALVADKCNNFKISGIKFINSQQMHISLDHCIGVKIFEIEINAPKESPNTDGIHIGQSQQVEVWRSKIGTGDDCISIGTGTSNVSITEVLCGPGHGISIGSLGRDSEAAAVESIHVRNCTFTNTMNGVRVKTWQGGSGYARNIIFDDIIMLSVDQPVIIDQYYCNGKHGCGNETSAVKLSDISFVNVRGTSAKETAINLACSKTVPCTNINLDHVILALNSNKDNAVSYCLNAKGRSSAVSPPVSCLS